ncbi:UNVERIFIED_CONTAM: hypothetical protein Sangu_2584900 [Sesamum angustifolium]|uniref:Uncharacterized protein n=1 Tax=Sesamum angustifolium TaxID=2727405 RepID=A0AAW2J6H6_9LAMI
MTEIRELNEEAYNWLGMIDKTQWTLSHDSGWRTGILTTNMSECVNGVLKGARRLPIVAIVQITFHRSVRYFLERTTRCHRMLNANQEWADFAFRIFEARQAEAVHHIVQKFDYNQQSASVLTLSLTGQGSHTYVVKLKHKTCSWQVGNTWNSVFTCHSSKPTFWVFEHIERHIKGGLSHCMGKSIGIPLTLNLCIIRRSEFAEDQADMFRRIPNEWIDHKHVLANNINLVKFRINCHNVDVVCSDGDEYPAALLWACLHPSHQMALVRSQDVFVSLDGCYVQSLQRKMHIRSVSI